ncbi:MULTISPECIES: hypothetical protein [unclassified Terrabacter]|uniref:hypothetical protein n=1 Tax=unclassified Terrabacter TaxID=2630222 RepID=UPI0006F51F03|nr:MULTISPECIES: hypothetical protein [unclassified Terrabacter]KRB46904.1 hypothetical protein ASD90_00445 [Terrabacter sp. Root181]KRF38221.1 hypothetical protein ASG96_17315 [Terrabacter sp. Soil810]
MIRINVGGREYGSWDELPEDVRAQLLAAGVDPGPDGRLDSLDLSRASSSGSAVTRRTVVTGPDGAPLPPVVSQVLTSIADAVGSALRGDPAAAVRMQPGESTPPTVVPEVAPDADPDAVGNDDHHHEDPETEPDAGVADPGRSRRVPLALGWIIIAGTVLLVATVVVIGLSGV